MFLKLILELIIAIYLWMVFGHLIKFKNCEGCDHCFGWSEKMLWVETLTMAVLWTLFFLLNVALYFSPTGRMVGSVLSIFL